MDGLEAVEIKLSNLEFTKRIDSEYYRKGFLDKEHLLLRNSPVPLEQICKFIIGPFGSAFTVDNYTENSSYRYVRGKDVKPFVLQDNDNVYMPQADYLRLKKYALKDNDILISVVGTLGNSAIIKKNNLPAIFSCKSTVLRDHTVNPFFLLTYLNTAIIKDLLLRKTRGAVQLGLNLDDLKSVLVVKFSDEFQTAIENIYLASSKQLDLSKISYDAAEHLLLSHLGLSNFVPNPSGTAVKTLSQSFGASGRLDSEYYQPKYEEVLQAISPHHQRKLGGANGLVNIQKSIEPGSDCYGDEGIPFIRVSNLSKFEITTPDIKLPVTTVEGIEKLYPKKDTILLSKDGSVGIAYKVESDMEGITSGAILHLTVKDTTEVLPDFLTLVLNSKVVQMQAERDAGGSIIQHWKPSEIENVVIPILEMDKQIEIADKIQESFALRKKSVKLLELAKTAVEVAIEQGEEKAMMLLEEMV